MPLATGNTPIPKKIRILAGIIRKPDWVAKTVWLPWFNLLSNRMPGNRMRAVTYYGAVIVFAIKVTAVCASALPLSVAPVFIEISV